MNRIALICLGAILWFPGRSARADDAELAAKSIKVLEAYCHSCHGKDGRSEGGFNTVLDVTKLVASKRIVKGDAEKSKLLKKIISDEMPPETDDADRSATPKPLPRPSKEEIETLRRWITAGAPEPISLAPRPKRVFLYEADILKAISADLRAANERSRPFYRYFTTTHLYNAGLSDEQLLTYRHGLSKLVNSLSWGRRVVLPVPVDPRKTVFRVDLRDLTWSEATWEAILKQYPYGIVRSDPLARSVYDDTKCELPYFRADWFVHAASKPPLYHGILRIPPTVAELEKLLVVDVETNVRNERVARAAFNISGVSHNNRLIERHESTYGSYWKSYDFAGNVGRQNVLTHPLGPGDHAREFKHDGGEIIFSLPNGLQGYMLATADGQRIDKGPTTIVLDKDQPDSAVVNGVSCMKCHKYGMIEKSDQVRSLAEKDNVFSAKEAATIKAIYPQKGEFDRLLQEDKDRFAKALQATGAPLSTTEPVFALARQFENDLDPTLAAAEAGLPLEDFLKQLKGSARLLDSLASLLLPEGSVKRDSFVSAFPSLATDLHLGRWLRSSGLPIAAKSADPFPVGSIWIGKAGPGLGARWIVHHRNGDQVGFRMSSANDQVVREVSTTLRGNTMQWNAANSTAIKGGKGGDGVVIIQGDRLELTMERADGNKVASAFEREAGRGGEAVRQGTVWQVAPRGVTITITAREGSRFQGRLEIGQGNIVRVIDGTLLDDRMYWYGRDVKAIKGGAGQDNFGIIRGNEIQFYFIGPKAEDSGSFTVHRK